MFRWVVVRVRVTISEGSAEKVAEGYYTTNDIKSQWDRVNTKLACLPDHDCCEAEGRRADGVGRRWTVSLLCKLKQVLDVDKGHAAGYSRNLNLH